VRTTSSRFNWSKLAATTRTGYELRADKNLVLSDFKGLIIIKFIDQFEAEIGSLTELLEREKKKSETLEKQLGELHDQHETQQYFATLYKVTSELCSFIKNQIQSQVREKKDELEDEKANIEALNGRIQQLEQEKAKMNVAHMKMTEERQQRFNQELDRLANESSGISHRELEDSKSRIRELEQALFNANDSYEEINRENEMLQRKIDELDGIFFILKHGDMIFLRVRGTLRQLAEPVARRKDRTREEAQPGDLAQEAVCQQTCPGHDEEGNRNSALGQKQKERQGN